MIRLDRLMLSDVLLRALRKNETEAVLAREFVHLRRHHRAILLGSAVVSLPLIYRFSHLAMVEGRGLVGRAWPPAGVDHPGAALSAVAPVPAEWRTPRPWN